MLYRDQEVGLNTQSFVGGRQSQFAVRHIGWNIESDNVGTHRYQAGKPDVGRDAADLYRGPRLGQRSRLRDRAAHDGRVGWSEPGSGDVDGLSRFDWRSAGKPDDGVVGEVPSVHVVLAGRRDELEER